ncbi:hypothetical protein L1280_001881 [Deinococcus sp. HSC-46F16]|uniref:hypothetical protein n=1 Tax=Deinococcus sp. HSC-46F16 TaxID=2910968 RepID=UPI00209C9124|nr:hypothetical protein [Deinococcus sp. HSC-46F16]MCP2014729.1 hypothetical protein [Deinococcus sp. HSC-46F16]
MEDGGFDLAGAREAAAQGRLAGWVDLHLRQPGGNPALADGLRLAPRLWEGPIQVRLSALERCCGPEPGMEYPEPTGSWKARVLALAAHVGAGGRLAPLIVQRRGGILSVRDGNHRLGALESLGESAAWVLIWTDAPAG